MVRTQRRIVVLSGAFFILLLIAIGRVFYLGIIRSSALRQVAMAQQQTSVTVPAMRGTIYDRTGLPLAVSAPADDVSATPYLIRDEDAAARRLGPLLGVARATVLAKLTNGRSGFVYLARGLPRAASRAVAALGIPGISLTPTELRVYPHSALASQVLGTVGVDGEGLSGIEQAEDPVLSARDGRLTVISDARGSPISTTVATRAQPGLPVQLTLDAALQRFTEAVLHATGASDRPRWSTAVVVDPRTNTVLAMANWPNVDANDVAGAPPYARVNHGVSMAFQPGATFDPVAVAGAMQARLISPATSFLLPARLRLPGLTLRGGDSTRPEALTTGQIVASASDVGVVHIGLLLGPRRFDSWVRGFGFGSPLGLKLPDEVSGNVPRLAEYSAASMGRLPIGQGVTVSALQLATGYASIADGGIARNPRLVAAAAGQSQAVDSGRRLLSPAVASALTQMLVARVAAGSDMAVPSYRVGGEWSALPDRTAAGTGHVLTSAVGFAPARAPRLLVVVAVDQPHGGGTDGLLAAPQAFAKIMTFALHRFKVPPT
jgi:cell division protein FtsI/penicillin-binding protein 2